MTFWPLANSDFPTDQTFHQFHDLYTELDLHRIMSGFHGAFATGVASQQGTLTLPDTWFRPPFWDLLMLQLLRPNSSNLPCLYSTFHLEYPLVLSRFSRKWKCEVDLPTDWQEQIQVGSRKCCSPLWLWSQVQGDTSDRYNSQNIFFANINYCLTLITVGIRRRNRCP